MYIYMWRTLFRNIVCTQKMYWHCKVNLLEWRLLRHSNKSSYVSEVGSTPHPPKGNHHAHWRLAYASATNDAATARFCNLLYGGCMVASSVAECLTFFKVGLLIWRSDVRSPMSSPLRIWISTAVHNLQPHQRPVPLIPCLYTVGATTKKVKSPHS